MWQKLSAKSYTHLWPKTTIHISEFYQLENRLYENLHVASSHLKVKTKSICFRHICSPPYSTLYWNHCSQRNKARKRDGKPWVSKVEETHCLCWQASCSPMQAPTLRENYRDCIMRTGLQMPWIAPGTWYLFSRCSASDSNRDRPEIMSWEPVLAKGRAERKCFLASETTVRVWMGGAALGWKEHELSRSSLGKFLHSKLSKTQSKHRE